MADPSIHMLHNYADEGLSLVPNGVHSGSNGGYQAVNISVLANVRRVLLLGYDMHFPGGKSHWHTGHLAYTPQENYGMYNRKFGTMLPCLKQQGIEVINCSAISTLRIFPKMTVEQALSLP